MQRTPAPPVHGIGAAGIQAGFVWSERERRRGVPPDPSRVGMRADLEWTRAGRIGRPVQDLPRKPARGGAHR